ncbi:energy-coupling factor transporter transmembrane component T [Streptomyces pathocidini]|uniref:Energy-coupling factor transporter transmembrane component T n=1 Tax=Streptomyces pathocidini TaxID=1650571 RepID=A0ABW7US40_9ACTN
MSDNAPPPPGRCPASGPDAAVGAHGSPDALATTAAAGERRARTPRRVPSRAPRAARRSGSLHPGAWWLWALGLATAASRTTNPLLLGLLLGVAGYVVAARRTDAPWARSYTAFLKLGLFVIGIRLVFSVVLGSPVPGSTTLLTLPEVPLPGWAQGVRIGGRVTAEGVVFALYDGLKLATLLACLGAANALANPARLLKSLPGALYEAGVAVVVAMTFAPHLVSDVVRLRAARRLRGRTDKGLRALLRIGLPVLEGALERSVALAAAMDARGYGRTADVPRAVRRTTAWLTLGGLLGVCAGTYGLLAAQGAAFGLPVLLAGLAAALAGLRLGGRRTVRTRYRPDAWGARAWLVSGSGAAVAAAMIWSGAADPASLQPSIVPLAAPGLPLWPAAAILLGMLPAVVAPAPAPPTTPAAPEPAPAPTSRTAHTTQPPRTAQPTRTTQPASPSAASTASAPTPPSSSPLGPGTPRERRLLPIHRRPPRGSTFPRKEAP